MEIINAAVRRGLDGIALTDHDNMRGIPAARRYIKEQKLELILVPGVEVTTSEGHLLILGVEEPPKRKLSPEETIEAAHALGGIADVPHPYHPFRNAIGRIRMWTPWRSITQSIYLVLPWQGLGRGQETATCQWWQGATRTLPRPWAWE